MISAFRRYLETWPVRLLFGLMVIAFVIWGVGDVIRQVGTVTWLAKVGGRTIEPEQFDSVLQRDVAQAERQLPPGQDFTSAMRRAVATQSLQRLIGQVAMEEEIHRLRVVVPDAALRQAVFDMPAFKGPNGQFDRSRLDELLRNNGLSEAGFLDLVRGQLANEQVLSAVTAGAQPPDILTRALFAFAKEKRSALMVEVPFAAAATPPAPTEAELQRWYDNHPWLYRTPEYRRIRAVVLTPDSVAKTITVSDAELQAYYDEHKADYVTPATRSVQVLVLHDEAKAKALAAKWQGGADWASMQAAAKAAGGTAVALDDTTEAGIPETSLAKAAFSAKPDEVAPPVKTALGWDVLKVTKASPGSAKTLAEVKDAVRKRVLANKASDQIYDVANKVDNILGTGVGLHKLPAGVGLVGMTGTLDAAGDTEQGTPAPLPGSPELRKALIAAAFKTPQGQPPGQLTEVHSTSANGGSSYYALTVESVTPASKKPFAAVKETVATQWTHAAREKEAERTAAKLLTAINSGQSIADAATVAGLTVRETSSVTRNGHADDMPSALQEVLFELKPKEPTMVQNESEFIVAVPDKIEKPDPKADASGYDAMKAVLTRSLAGDIATTFETAVRTRASPRINQSVFNGFTNPGQ